MPHDANTYRVMQYTTAFAKLFWFETRPSRASLLEAARALDCRCADGPDEEITGYAACVLGWLVRQCR